MRSDLNDFVTKYLSLVGAALMIFGFVAFVLTVYDPVRATGDSGNLEVPRPAASTQAKN